MASCWVALFTICQSLVWALLRGEEAEESHQNETGRCRDLASCGLRCVPVLGVGKGGCLFELWRVNTAGGPLGRDTLPVNGFRLQQFHGKQTAAEPGCSQHSTLLVRNEFPLEALHCCGDGLDQTEKWLTATHP